MSLTVTTDPGTPSVAVLRQQLHNVQVGITIPSSNKMLGTSFNLPVSDLSLGGTLFIGNPSATSVDAIVQYGSSIAPPNDHVNIPPFGVTSVKLVHGETNVMITVTNGVPVIVQAAIGARFQIVLPIGPAV